MLSNFFSYIIQGTAITIGVTLVALPFGLLLGLLMALVHTYGGKISKPTRGNLQPVITRRSAHRSAIHFIFHSFWQSHQPHSVLGGLAFAGNRQQRLSDGNLARRTCSQSAADK